MYSTFSWHSLTVRKARSSVGTIKRRCEEKPQSLKGKTLMRYPACPSLVVAKMAAIRSHLFSSRRQTSTSPGGASSTGTICQGKMGRFSGLFLGSRAKPGPGGPGWVCVKFVGGKPGRNQATEHSSQNSSQRPLSWQHRNAMIALA